MISELMQYQISPEGIDTLMECAGEQSLLYRKLSDVKIIYREFSDYMKSRYVTPEEVLDVLCRVIKKCGQSERKHGRTRRFYRFYSGAVSGDKAAACDVP